MITLTYNIQIKAPKEKVWEMLWDDHCYRTWTGIFTEGSHAVTDWKEGGSILFLNGQGQGMFSIIAKNRPCEFMSFKHLGEIIDGKEVPFKEGQAFGSMENYTLTESDGFTKLTVELDTEENYQDYFNVQFPLALETLKALVEK